MNASTESKGLLRIGSDTDAAGTGSANTAKSITIEWLQYYTHTHTHTYTYRVSQEECARLRESVHYVKLYRYNPKHPYPKLNGYGDNGQRSLKL